MARTPAKKPATKRKTPARKPTAKKTTTRKPAAHKTATKTTTTNTKNLMVVGLGASAGGLEALRVLLRDLAVNTNMCYVIAQHLDAKHQSLLATLLDRETEMHVGEAKDNELLVPNRIYVCPQNRDLTIRNGKIRLRKPRHTIGPKPSVDLFLTSLAEDFGEHGIGVILSGTGSDGAHGIRAVKAANGITIAQDKDSAKYDGMPVAAVDTGTVDLVLPPDRIAAELRNITSVYPARLPIPKKTEEGFSAYDRILMRVKKRTDADFTDYKESTILRRINRRMVAQRIESIEEYAQLVDTSTTEVDDLCKDLLISVTSFFRDKEAFASVNKVLGEIVGNKKEGEHIRIWVPGCSTGEEVYSIAILVAEALGSKVADFNIQIFGTDLDPGVTAVARKGVYPEVAIENIDDSILARYFTRSGNTYQINKTLREMVIFAKQDLVRDPPFLRLDLISCRNLLIYFNAALQKRTLDLFHYALLNGGYLFLGKSETIGQFTDLFEPMVKKWRIFKRKQTFRDPLIRLSTRPVRAVELTTGTERRAIEQAQPIDQVMYRVQAEAFAPPSVVVSERMDIEYVHGEMDDYLRIAPGKFGATVLDVTRDELRATLRALLHKSFRDNSDEVSRALEISSPDGPAKVKLSVRPFGIAGKSANYALVSFEKEASHGVAVLETGEAASAEDARIQELEQELAATREHLQTVVEELETSNEELQSLNEELQSSNEELQSSNEELETSNEELQSTNEELVTVNEELQVKSNELADTNTDLVNILNSAGYPLVVVDRSLKVKRYSPQAGEVFTLSPNDVGQVITSIPCRLDLPNLRNNLEAVIERMDSLETEIKENGQVYQMKVGPYLDERSHVAGAVVSFIDITEITDVRSKLRSAQDELQRLGKLDDMFSEKS